MYHLLDVEVLDDVSINTFYFAMSPNMECYFRHNIVCNKLFFYFLTSVQSVLDAYPVQDGMSSSYHVDMKKNDDGMWHSLYGKNRCTIIVCDSHKEVFHLIQTSSIL